MANFQNEKLDAIMNYLKKADSSKIRTNETFINLSNDLMKVSDFVTSGYTNFWSSSMSQRLDNNTPNEYQQVNATAQFADVYFYPIGIQQSAGKIGIESHTECTTFTNVNIMDPNCFDQPQFIADSFAIHVPNVDKELTVISKEHVSFSPDDRNSFQQTDMLQLDDANQDSSKSVLFSETSDQFTKGGKISASVGQHQLNQESNPVQSSEPVHRTRKKTDRCAPDYKDKRLRNNVAVKKSRRKSKEQRQSMEWELEALRSENNKLRDTIQHYRTLLIDNAIRF